MPFRDKAATERRNIERVHAWADAWKLPGGSAEKMVSEVYGDAPEVISVLQGLRVAADGELKDAWKAAELKIEQHYTERKVIFEAIHASGDTVAFEGRVEMITREGEERGWPFAAFLTFDDDGRIVKDHTYMPDSPHGDLFEEAASRASEQTREQS